MVGKIIKQMPWGTDTEIPQAQDPGKTQQHGLTEGSPKPSKTK
jgi:hypothetical protein